MSTSLVVAEKIWNENESTRSGPRHAYIKLNHYHCRYILLLVDQRGVKRISGQPSGRSVFQCKHQLAARLAKSLGACIEVMVSDEELAVMLSQL